MTPVFADTSFYVALTNPRDAHHARAVGHFRGRPGKTITTEYVLTEFANFMTHPALRPVFVDTVAAIRADPKAVIVPSTSEGFARGLALFTARADKTWSLTDCISFAVMTDRGLTAALTADHHFTQAGFAVLLA